jgi:hypothetical protein
VQQNARGSSGAGAAGKREAALLEANYASDAMVDQAPGAGRGLAIRHAPAGPAAAIEAGELWR